MCDMNAQDTDGQDGMANKFCGCTQGKLSYVQYIYQHLLPTQTPYHLLSKCPAWVPVSH
jgi:hypothetical protein